jgi:hypothetical protein
MMKHSLFWTGHSASLLIRIPTGADFVDLDKNG